MYSVIYNIDGMPDAEFGNFESAKAVAESIRDIHADLVSGEVFFDSFDELVCDLLRMSWITERTEPFIVDFGDGTTTQALTVQNAIRMLIYFADEIDTSRISCHTKVVAPNTKMNFLYTGSLIIPHKPMRVLVYKLPYVKMSEERELISIYYFL